MRTNRLLAAAALMVLTSAAGAITTDGDWSDWFSYTGDVGANTWDENLVTLNSPNIRTQIDEEGPTPGSGGQFYDVEQIFYAFDDVDTIGNSGGTLRIGLVTGFPSDGRSQEDLYAGDMFIDFGNTGTYGLAVATSTSAANVDVPGGVDADYFGNNYFNDGTANWILRAPTLFSQSTPWRVDRNAAIENQFASSVAWGHSGVHYFLELEVTVDAALGEILTNPQGGLGLHWTMECGNDTIGVHDDTPLDPLLPIPEPATVILMGMGLAGIEIRRRFTA